MKQPWVYTCAPSWTPPPTFPPNPIPLGPPSAPALSTLSYALNPHWWSVSHMIIYMFQWDSPKSSHPRLLPQSPKDFSIHLCVFCCLTYRVIIIIFLNSIYMRSDQIRSDQSLSRVWLFATRWIAACQASLSITISRSSLRLTSIKSVMPSSHLILCCPLLLLPSSPPSIKVFSNESALRMRWPKYWSFSFSIIPSKEIPGLISFRMDLLDLLVSILYWCFSFWLTSFCIIVPVSSTSLVLIQTHSFS